MTSACIFKDTLRNETQVFHEFKDSFFEICLHLINSNSTTYFLTSSMLSGGAGTAKEIPPDQMWGIITRNNDHFLISFFQFSCSIKKFIQFHLKIQHGFKHFNRFSGFRRILRGATLEGAKSTTKQLPEYSEFDGAIRDLHNRAAYSFLGCIPRTTNRNSQWWLQWTDNAIRISINNLHVKGPVNIRITLWTDPD